jgi:two-component system, OmpR family, KDP operon response regulator KdpE
MTQTADTSVLIIEDEPEIRHFLKTILIHHHFKPSFAETAREGVKLISLHAPDIIILDLGLPDMDGLDVIKSVRTWSHIPIIVLSARGREQDKVSALDLGADDYLTKPFGAGELLARLKVMQRHTHHAIGKHSPIFVNGAIHINLDKREVSVDNRTINLTPTEYKMLCVLAKYVGKVVTYKQLLHEVWGKNAEDNQHYLRIYAQHLRRKLADDPILPKYIVTEAGVGYRMKAL